MSRNRIVLTPEIEQKITRIFDAQIKLRKKVNIKEAMACLFGKSAEGGTYHRLLAEFADKNNFPRVIKTSVEDQKKIIMHFLSTPSNNGKNSKSSKFFQTYDAIPGWVISSKSINTIVTGETE